MGFLLPRGRCLPRRRPLRVHYGTLPGHLERGEETFTLERLRDGRTLLLIDAASEPFRPFLRPLVDVPRRLLISRLYLHALDD